MGEIMPYQVHKSIYLRDSWPNTRCHSCGEAVDLDAWRNVKIGWSDVLVIAIDLLGPPTGFFNQDFLIVLEFGAVKLTFCGQGPRRGEIGVSVPVDDDRADVLLKTFLDRIREIIEAIACVGDDSTKDIDDGG